MNPQKTLTHIPMLERAANQLLSVVAPSASRLVYAEVVVQEHAETACTDGAAVIYMPRTFSGEPIPENEAVSVGLLAHELGHFFQPLHEIAGLEQSEGVPHWLANIVLDIQGETMMEGFFPALQPPLAVVRKVVRDELEREYRQAIAKATNLVELACPLALLGRFIQPQSPFAPQDARQAVPTGLESSAARYLNLLWQASDLEPYRLPAHLRTILEFFPELAQLNLPQWLNPLDGLANHLHGTLGELLASELRNATLGWMPSIGNPIQHKAFTVVPPMAEAVTLARAISTRFTVPQGKSEIVAPGRLERREMVTSLLPFRMSIPGNERPAPKVVICVDVSSSMDCDDKQAHAFLAAQAVALAVKASGGEVVGLLFDQRVAVSLQEDASPLFAPEAEWSMDDGTSFHFLNEAWRRWPQHRILLITDGQGDAPTVLPTDRKRTSAIVIPDGSAKYLRPICAHVVTLDEPRLLPSVLATLIPRAAVA